MQERYGTGAGTLDQAHQNYVAAFARLADWESVGYDSIEKLRRPRQGHGRHQKLRLSRLQAVLVLKDIEEGKRQHNFHPIVEVLET